MDLIEFSPLYFTPNITNYGHVSFIPAGSWQPNNRDYVKLSKHCLGFYCQTLINQSNGYITVLLGDLISPTSRSRKSKLQINSGKQYVARYLCWVPSPDSNWEIIQLWALELHTVPGSSVCGLKPLSTLQSTFYNTNNPEKLDSLYST